MLRFVIEKMVKVILESRSYPGQAAQHSVHPTGGTLRVFRQFLWLGLGSGKMVLSRPTHQRVTLTVRRLHLNHHKEEHIQNDVTFIV